MKHGNCFCFQKELTEKNWLLGKIGGENIFFFCKPTNTKKKKGGENT